jgi:hypothetical protein
MKLNLIFIVMDLLTILAYPFVFVYGIFHWLSKVNAKAVLVSNREFTSRDFKR